MDKITYKAPTREDGRWEPDNSCSVQAFIGPQPPCPLCQDKGEYESEFGPKGCDPCNSRVIAFIDYTGKRVYADWGDSIEKREDGLHLVDGAERLRERAEGALAVHNGVCSILKKHELEPSFRDMEREGLVKIIDSATPDMLDIRRIKE